MVRRSIEHGWALTRQPAHAALAAHLADALGCQPSGPAEGFALAVRHHDDGWDVRDREVRVGPEGTPETFLDLDLVDHIEIARGSVARATSLDPYAGALVARYAAYLHGGRPVADDGERALRDRATGAWETLAAGLVEGTVAPTAVESDVAILGDLDRLSLWLCGWPADEVIDLVFPDGRAIRAESRGDIVAIRGAVLAAPVALAVDEEVVGAEPPFAVRERRTRTITLHPIDG